MNGLPHVVLAVKDGFTFCELSQALAENGYPVTAVRTGKEAYDCLIEPDAPKVVILDRGLRGKHGDDIVRLARARFRDPADYVFCILLDDVGDGAPTVPADSVIDYPVRPARVLNALNSVLRLNGPRVRKSGIVQRHRINPDMRDTVDIDTGVWDRATIERHVGDALLFMADRGGCVGLVRVVIDDFARVGEAWGEDAERLALRSCSRIVRDQVRSCEGIGRIGPAEFLIVTYGHDPNGASYVADRVQGAVGRFALNRGDAPVRFTTSVGVVVSWTHRDSAQLYEMLDEAVAAARGVPGDEIVAWVCRDHTRVAI